jgi:CRP/FNR family transcriptional regulator
MTQPISFKDSTKNLATPAVIDELKAKCGACSLRELCLPVGLTPTDMDRLDSLISKRRQVAKRDALYRKEASFTSLYAIRTGHFKTMHITADGRQQITGFQMTGELLGMDAISAGRHQCDAIAIEDSEVCEIPYARLEQLIGEVPALLRQFHRLMSREITREQTAILSLGNLTAEQRFAGFLVNLSARYALRDKSPVNFTMRMGREEIGNYLGLTIESISRLLTAFKKRNILVLDGRNVEIVDISQLRELAAAPLSQR